MAATVAALDARLTDLLKPSVEMLGFELLGVELNSGVVRLYIDCDAGVTVDNCAYVSRQVGAVLDVEDPIAGNFTLEVSSPGLDRRLFSLDQFAAFAGTEVKLKLKRAFEGKRKFRGQLRGVEGDEIIVGNGDDEILFPFEVIERANVVPEI